jgi:hypothetical protein
MAPRSESEKVRPKKSYFASACEYVKLPFSLRVPKKLFSNFWEFMATAFCGAYLYVPTRIMFLSFSS